MPLRTECTCIAAHRGLSYNGNSQPQLCSWMPRPQACVFPG
uniref:Uncharacterized protein n=1 Tax=Arundo donax TaxID=35708 RepID=A0A0A9A1X4_ARUDO